MDSLVPQKDRLNTMFERDKRLSIMLCGDFIRPRGISGRSLDIAECLEKTAVDDSSRPYIECFRAGFRFLRLVKMSIDRPSNLSAFSGMECGPSSVSESIEWKSRLNATLKTFSTNDTVSYLYSVWNYSHDAIPRPSEAVLGSSWYAHFQHSQCLLLSSINGFLWPSYLRRCLKSSLGGVIPLGFQDAYYALESSNSGIAWNWEAQDQHITSNSMRQQASIIWQIRLVKLLKAGRLLEAESILVECVDNLAAHKHQYTSRYIAIVIDSMRQRKAYAECLQYIDSLPEQLLGIFEWDLQLSICRLCVSIIDDGVASKMNDAEDLLVLHIIAVAEWGEKEKWAENLFTALERYNPVYYVAKVLGYLYAKGPCYDQAATLMSWVLCYGRNTPEPAIVEALLRCYRGLDIMNQSLFEEMYEENSNPSLFGSRGGSCSASGAWAIVKDSRFQKCNSRIRELESVNQSVKKRFYEFLRRRGRDDFHHVDAVWDTMIKPNGGFDEWLARHNERLC